MINLKLFANIKQCITASKAPTHSAEKLKKGGFSIWAAKAAGYSLKELAEAGYSAEELIMVGYSKNDVEVSIQKK